MDLLWSLVGAVVWFVFLSAGLRKLRDATGTAAAMRGFGLPVGSAQTLAPLLPWLELAVAALLLVPTLAWLGAGLAAGLLLVFTGLILQALLRGQRPACNCFGHAAAQPISWATAARNALLLALSLGLLLGASGWLDAGLINLWAHTAGSLSPLALTLCVVCGLALAQAVVIGKLFSQQGRLLLRIDNLEHGLAQLSRDSSSHAAPALGPALGAPAPDFMALPLHGTAPVSVAQRLAAQREVVMLFVSPDCAPCHEVLAWLSRRRPSTPVLVVTSGSPALNTSKLKGVAPVDVLIQNGQEAQDLYGVIGTPSALRIRDGLVASPTAVGMAPIQSLFEPEHVGALLPAAAAGSA